MEQNTRIGFIGLGIMGQPMARNLLEAGYALTVWNRSQPGIDALVKDGATEGASPKDVAERSNIVITIVGDAPDVEQVALGDDGIIEGAHDGLIHIDMTTQSPSVTRQIAERYAQAGIELIDAPVSGGERGAIDGTLSIMTGGKREVFERCQSVFDAMGKTIVYCGLSGSGQVVKLCNQVVVGLNNLAMSEALVLAAKAGVAPATMIEAVRAGAGSSWALQNLAPRILDGDFAPGFKIAHQQKDLRLALELADQSHTPLPGTALVHQLFSALEADGMSEEGTQALVKALEKLAGVSLRE
ncbi:MAG: NAD-binding protein [Chloroflexi bacterium]|nr:NAD-binding protein [Chloroflexota bacterium]